MLFDTIVFKIVLERAIEAEEAAFRFYSEAAARTEAECSRVLFKELAGNELEHRMNLEKVRLRGDLEDITVSNIPHFSACSETVERMENSPARQAVTDERTVLMTALEMEQDAADGYSALAGETKHPVLEKLFRYLAGEEERHIGAIKKRLEEKGA